MAHAATTPAEEYIHRIAKHVGMTDDDAGNQLTNLFKNMKQQYVTTQWQLSNLDSYQWQSLGAPIGLVSGLRHFSNSNHNQDSSTSSSSSSFDAVDNAKSNTSNRKATPSHNKKPKISELPSFISSTRGGQSLMQGMSDSSSYWAEASDEFPTVELMTSIRTRKKGSDGMFQLDNMAKKNIQEELRRDTIWEEKEVVEEPDEEKEENGTSADEKPHSSPFDDEQEEESVNDRWCCMGMLDMFSMFPLKYTGMKMAVFPLSQQFRKAILHSKKGNEVKSHTIFTMEMNILSCALILGAAVELWGIFPFDVVASDGMDVDDDVPYVPKMWALLYHLFSCISILIQVLSASGWIWTLYAAGAVSPAKFKSFMIQIETPFGILMTVTEMGENIFCINVSFLLAAIIASTTTNTIWRWLGFWAPLVFVLVVCKFFNYLATFIGRVAYHGMMLCDNNSILNGEDGVCSQLADTMSKGCAARAESKLRLGFRKGIVIGEDRVLDTYHCALATAKKDQNLEDYILQTHDNRREGTHSFSMGKRGVMEEVGR